jgi:hypothetical protein
VAIYRGTNPPGGATVAENSKFDAADWVVLATCELVAGPLCHAGWEAVVNDENMGRGIVALAVGIPLRLIGGSFHWWKDKLPILSAGLLAISKRWWPAALAIALIYALLPSIVSRTLNWVNAPSAVGKVVWNFDQTAKGGGWFLTMFKTATQEIRVLGFVAHGKNISKDPIHELQGWVRSDPMMKPTGCLHLLISTL